MSDGKPWPVEVRLRRANSVLPFCMKDGRDQSLWQSSHTVVIPRSCGTTRLRAISSNIAALAGVMFPAATAAS